MPALRILRHVPIRGTIHCLTGLRIGGSKDDIEIGAIDNPIVRDPRSRAPYIPGSSLKGKMRSSLEYNLDKVGQNGSPCGCANSDCVVCVLFGPHRKPMHGLGPSRLLVRDATLVIGDGEDPDRWVEVKSENNIDRRTGVAGSPRLMERVVPNARFRFEITVRVFDGDDRRPELMAAVRKALNLIELDYLGASGSRGYGKVRFEFETPAEWLGAGQ